MTSIYVLFSALETSYTCRHTSGRWRPPTVNIERITAYKLMLATTGGAVTEAYQGLATEMLVKGLKPRTEYVLCVKASYADGSFLYSESKIVSTRAA